MRSLFLLLLLLVQEKVPSLDEVISILTYLWARNTYPAQMFPTASRKGLFFCPQKELLTEAKVLWLVSKLIAF